MTSNDMQGATNKEKWLDCGVVIRNEWLPIGVGKRLTMRDGSNDAGWCQMVITWSVFETQPNQASL